LLLQAHAASNQQLDTLRQEIARRDSTIQALQDQLADLCTDTSIAATQQNLLDHTQEQV
jgi:negative regulator of sigma E activity